MRLLRIFAFFSLLLAPQCAWAACDFRAAGALEEAIADLTVDAAPAGLATNDIELLAVETMDEAVSLSTTGGFVQTADSPQSVASGTATIATRLTLFWRRYAGQADPVITDPGNHAIAVRIAFSGCITTGDPWDVTVGSTEATEDTTGSATGDTTTVANTFVVMVTGHAKPDIAGGTAEMSAHANADLGSVTERFDDAAASGNGGWIGVITGTKAASGSFGATTYTKASASFKAHIVLALKEATAAACTKGLNMTLLGVGGCP